MPAMKKLPTPSRIAVFLKHPTKFYLLEAFVLLVYARILVVFRPFKKIAPTLGTHMQETSTEVSSEQLEKAKAIGRAIKRVSQFTPFRSMCFEQAITASIMLSKRGIETTTYFGVLKDKSVKEGLKAHAWIKVGESTITGNRGMNKFTVVSSFGN